MEGRVWITWWIIFCIRYSRLFWIHERVTDSGSIFIYTIKVASKITFKIKTRYYLELLTPETFTWKH